MLFAVQWGWRLGGAASYRQGSFVRRFGFFVSRASRQAAVLGFCSAISGCAVGKLSAGRVDGSPTGRLHQSFLTEAAAISKSAWDEVRSSGSKIGAWTTILMEGRDESDPTALAASSKATSPAASYLALKAETYATPKDQLRAVVADLRAKTAEVDQFIGFATELSEAYRAEANEPALGTRRAEADRATAKADRYVLEHSVAELKSQRATFEAVGRQLGDQMVDTSALDRALVAFNERIEKVGALALAMDAPNAG